MGLVDTHAHLEELADVGAAIERAKKVGVAAIVAVSTSLKACERTLGLAREHQGYVYPALGIHPQEVGESYEDDLNFVEAHLVECIAIGEVGLDYWIKGDRKLQTDVFTRLLEDAASNNLPVIVHSRGSWEDCYILLKERGVKRAVFHWYSGPLEVLRSIIDSGYFISATPAIEYSRAHREAVRSAPIDALMLETDCPVKYRGKDSEPADVVRTLSYVAAIKGLAEREVASKTTENAIKLFRLSLYPERF
jgi:TatD DNase family protein